MAFNPFSNASPLMGAGSAMPSSYAPFYDERRAKRDMNAQGFMAMGEALLGMSGPQPMGNNFFTNLGSALKAGREGAQKAGEDYMTAADNNFKRWDMDKQSKREDSEWNDKQKRKAAFDSLVEKMPPDLKAYAQANPDAAMKLYEERYFPQPKDPVKELQLQKLQMELKQMGQPKVEPPKSRDFIQGNERVTQEFDASTGQWKEIGRGPAYKTTPDTQINMGGGSDKQIFDAMNESAVSARSARLGLSSLKQARDAVKGGIISGAFADQRLGLQKIGAAVGVADPSTIQNTETFRAAIAPQVAALMKATVGSTQISNADREFAERAAGGSINLDAGTISRLLDIMEKANNEVVRMHQERLDAVYPDNGQFQRERALFGIGAGGGETVIDGYKIRKK